MLGRRIAARPRPLATVRDLEIALLEEWNSIPQSLIDNLIASMANSSVARFNETFPQAELPRYEQVESEAAHRAAETPDQSQARRLQHATYMASQRDTETIEATESRKRAVAERAQQRRLIFTKKYVGVFDKAAFEYDETLDYESHKLIKIEAMINSADFEVLLNGKRNLQKNSLVYVALYHIHHIWRYRVRLRESGTPIGRLRKTCKKAFPRTIPVSFGRLDTPIATESSLNVHLF
ncbi:uncharacterized protein TNCV_1464171 [Trichonephila clavipes]|nr:uncharacterized protein TNCV_1464171 [Trichonephila clavipes]